MGVTLKRPLTSLASTTLFTKDDWETVGRIARERIIRRTQAGLDVEGRAFEPLSAGYAKQKREALGHDRADLQVSGEMLRAIAIEATDRKVTLFFSR